MRLSVLSARLPFATMTAPPEWRFRGLGSVGSTGLVALADAAVLRFEERGLALPPDNRLERAREIIRQSHDRRLQVTGAGKDTALLAEAVRNAWELYLIARTLPRDRDADLDGKLKLLLRGGGSRRLERSRDAQFELLVAARFAMAEIPTWPAEPDLRFTLASAEWGAAVKRVRSEGQLAKRTAQARKQLEKQGLRGVIAVNVDHFVAGIPARGGPVEVGHAVDQSIVRLRRLYPQLAQQRSLLGIMVMGHVVDWVFGSDKPRMRHAWIFQGRAFVDDGEARNPIHELFERLEQSEGQRTEEMYREIRQLMPRGQ